MIVTARINSAFAIVIAALCGTSAVSAEDPKWSAGPLMLVSTSVFEGEGTEIKVVPGITYNGDRVFLRGLEAGFRLVKPPEDGPPFGATVEAIAAARFLLGDARDNVSLDAGFRVRYNSPFGFLAIKAIHDASGTHNGAEFVLRYGYRFSGDGWSFRPSISGTWQSTQLAQYLWADELSAHQAPGGLRTRDVLDGSVINWSVEYFGDIDIGDRLRLTSFGGVTRLDGEIGRLPWTTDRTELKTAIGLSYRF